MLNDLLGGILCIGCAAALTIREIVLGRQHENWPDAPNWLRQVLFVLLLVMIWRGMGLIQRWQHPTGKSLDIEGVATLAGWALYHWAVTANILMQKYPATLWARIKRVERLVRCADGQWSIFGARRRLEVERLEPGALSRPVVPTAAAAQAVAELTLLGVNVAAPGEGPAGILGLRETA